MEFFNKFEQKFQRYAIQNLMYYIVILYGIGLVIQLYDPMIYWTYLCLNPYMILRGQVWRAVTFLLYPPALGSSAFTSVFYGIIALFMYYSLGRTLERVWGSFRFNFFFFSGVILQVIADLAVFLITGSNLAMTTGYLNFSIFLAFAIYFPDIQFLLFFVIPIKAKWLAVAECAVYLYSFVFGSLGTRLEIAVSLANVILFLLLTKNVKRYSPREIHRKQTFRREVKIMPQGRTRHRCAVCGRTEQDDPNLEFRYCSRCQGDYEYCQDHLYTHKHVTDGSYSERQK